MITFLQVIPQFVVTVTNSGFLNDVASVYNFGLQVSCSSCPVAQPTVVTTLPGTRIIRQSSQPEASAPCCVHGTAPSTSLRQLRDHGEGGGIAGIAADSLRINGAMRNFRQVWFESAFIFKRQVITNHATHFRGGEQKPHDFTNSKTWGTTQQNTYPVTLDNVRRTDFYLLNYTPQYLMLLPAFAALVDYIYITSHYQHTWLLPDTKLNHRYRTSFIIVGYVLCNLGVTKVWNHTVYAKTNQHVDLECNTEVPFVVGTSTVGTTILIILLLAMERQRCSYRC